MSERQMDVQRWDDWSDEYPALKSTQGAFVRYEDYKSEVDRLNEAGERCTADLRNRWSAAEIERDQLQGAYNYTNGRYKEDLEGMQTLLNAANAKLAEQAHKLQQHDDAWAFDAPNDEALRSALPGKYLGQSTKGAAAKHIAEQAREIERLKSDAWTLEFQRQTLSAGLENARAELAARKPIRVAFIDAIPSLSTVPHEIDDGELSSDEVIVMWDKLKSELAAEVRRRKIAEEAHDDLFNEAEDHDELVTSSLSRAEQRLIARGEIEPLSIKTSTQYENCVGFDRRPEVNHER